MSAIGTRGRLNQRAECQLTGVKLTMPAAAGPGMGEPNLSDLNQASAKVN
jgi:hypothetical protein